MTIDLNYIEQTQGMLYYRQIDRKKKKIEKYIRTIDEYPKSDTKHNKLKDVETTTMCCHYNGMYGVGGLND